MGKIDPEEERQRLAERYAEMSDLELRKVGNDPESLTMWARKALEEEMLKRGLAWNPMPQSERDETIQHDAPPVVLRRYRDMPAAFVEKSVLENAGIPCFLQDDNVIRMDWLWSNAMGGIKLLVKEKDAADAEKLLSELAAANGETADNS